VVIEASSGARHELSDQFPARWPCTAKGRQRCRDAAGGRRSPSRTACSPWAWAPCTKGSASEAGVNLDSRGFIAVDRGIADVGCGLLRCRRPAPAWLMLASPWAAMQGRTRCWHALGRAGQADQAQPTWRPRSSRPVDCLRWGVSQAPWTAARSRPGGQAALATNPRAKWGGIRDVSSIFRALHRRYSAACPSRPGQASDPAPSSASSKPFRPNQSPNVLHLPLRVPLGHGGGQDGQLSSAPTDPLSEIADRGHAIAWLDDPLSFDRDREAGRCSDE